MYFHTSTHSCSVCYDKQYFTSLSKFIFTINIYGPTCVAIM